MLKPVPIGFWESERQCTWPQEVIVRLDERVLLKHITIVSKYDRSRRGHRGSSVRRQRHWHLPQARLQEVATARGCQPVWPGRILLPERPSLVDAVPLGRAK